MKEVVDSYTLDCSGADDTLEDKVGASITVFNNGDRQVGCSYISTRGICTWIKVGDTKNKVESALNSQCVHLFPIDSVEAG